MNHIFKSDICDNILSFIDISKAKLIINKPIYIAYYSKCNNLDIYQQKALLYAVNKKNILITGAGGCGKSHLIPHIKKLLTIQGKKIILSAMTGAASVLINTQTFHSILGIGIKNDLSVMLKHIYKSGKHDIWRTIDTILIDEVSMLSSELFGYINQIAQTIRKNNKPFGGIQFIFVGDFCQLPPVKCDSFCFEHDLWSEYVTPVYLRNIYRQQSTSARNVRFIECLNNIRMGNHNDNDIALLYSRMIKPTNKIIIPTILYSRNTDVDRINNLELERLSDKTPIRIFTCQKKIEHDHAISAKRSQYLLSLLDNVIEDKVKLAIGAQVILKINLDQHNYLVNGSKGIVVDFDKYPIVKFINGQTLRIVPHKYKIEFEEYSCDKKKYIPITIIKKQVPLKLAWALTIHCCQGASLDSVIVDVGENIFEYGQIYTALSRVRDIDNLYILGLDPSKIKINPEVKKFYNSLN